ncbi:MAG: Do family serine endopeptidase [Cyclobacteriaceae bacterium]|nr:Do family serine endopeptidase [Cyclobacteriaceae bacterium]
MIRLGSLVLVMVLIALGIIHEPQNTPGLSTKKSTALTSNYHAEDSSFQNSFVRAAELGAPAVVHIKSKVTVETRRYQVPDAFREFFDNDFWERFFGPPTEMPQQFSQASGSGVIINEDGYIVTNQHVIEGAQEIEVVLHDRRSYEGKVQGVDPLTDLALLKIETDNLQILHFGDSDQTRIGEWVLAVGNPFYNLSSTVTAGIISAKARNINLLQDQAAIESFIQTDAAVNRGNSGGALLNLQGELIGINTAIASPTGVYAGYSFAIPSNIVKKVVDDLMKHGEVQRAQLGVFIRDLDSEMIKEMNLQGADGVLVDSLMKGGAAQKAGLLPGDIITSIDGRVASNVAQLKATIGTYRPNEKISMDIIRGGKEKRLQVVLGSLQGPDDYSEALSARLVKALGADFKDLTETEKNKLGVTAGVQLVAIHAGKLRNETMIREGFVLLKVNDIEITSTTQLEREIKKLKGGVMLEGIYPGVGGKYYYAIGM